VNHTKDLDPAPHPQPDAVTSDDEKALHHEQDRLSDSVPDRHLYLFSG
jgi:hypothetical protein